MGDRYFTASVNRSTGDAPARGGRGRPRHSCARDPVTIAVSLQYNRNNIVYAIFRNEHIKSLSYRPPPMIDRGTVNCSSVTFRVSCSRAFTSVSLYQKPPDPGAFDITDSLKSKIDSWKVSVSTAIVRPARSPLKGGPLRPNGCRVYTPSRRRRRAGARAGGCR
ncbi:hypothetical protein EVAR_18677_1 [Eumeta japonica]|uniref:Uncharacterized protein n=1 Tax=Eumeta variegata TaxID=151549 RepID=A0A4C1U848_EUMVA|nr:hypothetical protein EVAR_18677_1 [Eumeta japonica]